MKTIAILTILLTISLTAEARREFKQPKGELICWSNEDPEDRINGYSGDLNESHIDDYGRRSFIMDFKEKSKYWGFFADGEMTTYGWSYSECEDMNYFKFPKEELKQVLRGSRSSLKVEYVAEGPDETTHTILRCVKMTDENPGRPVFTF